ncbi:hypothetical protein [Methylomicrobium sp. Wu6]|uniref:hypothetical protein n=1 Tax=Methylomicrobium sp. Wu6 TaxID=3107928 RepID=UPI002DD63DA5|nr:hypothetical protein [Methylomicrobium sp. Wu6]
MANDFGKYFLEKTLNQPLKIIYNILPEFGGAYGWIKRNGDEGNGVGPCIGYSSGWYGDHPVSQELQDHFSEWQMKFEREVSVWGNEEAFDWSTFHEVGLELCVRLKQEIGYAARIIYQKAGEDPNCDVENRLEVLEDGNYLVIKRRRELGFAFENK